jgi:hypothetical protein
LEEKIMTKKDVVFGDSIIELEILETKIAHHNGRPKLQLSHT